MLKFSFFVLRYPKNCFKNNKSKILFELQYFLFYNDCLLYTRWENLMTRCVKQNCLNGAKLDKGNKVKSQLNEIKHSRIKPDEQNKNKTVSLTSRWKFVKNSLKNYPSRITWTRESQEQSKLLDENVLCLHWSL